MLCIYHILYDIVCLYMYAYNNVCVLFIHSSMYIHNVEDYRMNENYTVPSNPDLAVREMNSQSDLSMSPLCIRPVTGEGHLVHT